MDFYKQQNQTKSLTRGIDTVSSHLIPSSSLDWTSTTTPATVYSMADLNSHTAQHSR